jgi:hypothetical protein
MNASREALDRLLDPSNVSVRLQILSRAYAFYGVFVNTQGNLKQTARKIR